MTRTINEMMRSDTWYNAINQYAMLHVIYRLNIFGGRPGGPRDGGFGGPGGGGRGGRGFGGGGWLAAGVPVAASAVFRRFQGKR